MAVSGHLLWAGSCHGPRVLGCLCPGGAALPQPCCRARGRTWEAVRGVLSGLRGSLSVRSGSESTSGILKPRRGL